VTKMGGPVSEMNQMESLFTKALKLKPPWMIIKVEFDEGGGSISLPSHFFE